MFTRKFAWKEACLCPNKDRYILVRVSVLYVSMHAKKQESIQTYARKDEKNLWLHCVPLPPSLPQLVDPIFQCGSPGRIRFSGAARSHGARGPTWGGTFKIFWGSAAPYGPALDLHNFPKSRSAIESRGSNRTVLYCNIALLRKLFLTVHIAKNFPRGEGVSGSRYAWKHQAKSRSVFTLEWGGSETLIKI